MKAPAQISVTESSEPLRIKHSVQLPKLERDGLQRCARWDRYIAVALVLVSFQYLCLFRRMTSMEPDEGILLQGAQRILSGQVLYRDFFSFYTPGSYYTLAYLFKIFGSSMVVGRMALVCGGALLTGIAYLLARRVCSRVVALTMAALATLTTLPSRFLVLHNWDSTLLACLAIYCAVRLLESPSATWAFAAGSFISLTLLFEQSKGAGIFLGLGAGFLTIFVLDCSAIRLRRGHLLALTLGLALPLAITFAYFAAQHATSIMLADWFWPLRHYSQANRVPYGYQNWNDEGRQAILASGSLPVRLIAAVTISPFLWIPALPLLACGYLLYWISRARRQPEIDAKWRYYIIVTTGFLGLALSAALTRADLLHFMYLQPLNCILLAWVIEGRDIPGRFFRAARPILAGYIVISLFFLGVIPLLRVVSAHDRLVTRRGTVTTIGKDTVVDYVQAHVSGGETIFVYPYLPLYYYLTATYSSVPYDYFQQGMHTGAQADEILRHLDAQHVKVVLFEIDFAEKIPRAWPETPLVEIANDPVANYIARNYRSCAVLKSPEEWRFLFMIRKDLACP